MQVLTGVYPASLCPTSQEEGGLVDHGQAAAAMTAPGSVPVSPMPPPAAGPTLPMPQPSGPQLPVGSRPGGHTAGSHHQLPGWAGKPSSPAGIWKDVP